MKIRVNRGVSVGDKPPKQGIDSDGILALLGLTAFVFFLVGVGIAS